MMRAVWKINELLSGSIEKQNKESIKIKKKEHGYLLCMNLNVQ